MMQPFLDYASNAWHTNFYKNLKTRLQAAQNKCIRFCLKLGDKNSITVKEIEHIKCLPIKLVPHHGINLDKSLKASASLNAFKHNIRTTIFGRDIKKSDRNNNFTTIYISIVSRSISIFCYFKLFAIFLIFSFSKEITMKIRLLQLSFCHPSHNFTFIYFLVFLVKLYILNSFLISKYFYGELNLCTHLPA